MRLEQFDQFFRQAPGFFVQAGADMMRFGFENQNVGLVDDAVAEVEPDPFGGGGPDFDGQHIVVARRGLVAQAAFDDGENDFLLLPMQERRAKVAKNSPRAASRRSRYRE